jgi:polysaccharide export outer membrane protein
MPTARTLASMTIAVALATAVAHAQSSRPPGQPSSSATQPRPATGDGRTTPETSGTAGRAAASVPADYRLSLGDKLRIEVYREPQLSQSVEVRPDGKITLPLVGDIAAAGSTPKELADRLTEQLREYVTTPVVTVIVAEATPPTVYVMGEVNSPGMQPVRTPTTVLQALAVAGGFKEFANTKKIRILRRGANGALQTIEFNYKEAVRGEQRPMFLQPGDTVIVP